MCRCARVGPVAGSSPNRVVISHGPPRRPNCCGAITAGRWVHGIKPDGAQPVCGRIASPVHGCTAVCVWPGVLSFASGIRRCAGAPRTSGNNSDGGHGPFASPVWPRRSRVRYSAPGRGLPGLSRMSSAVVRLACSKNRSNRTASLYGFILNLELL